MRGALNFEGEATGIVVSSMLEVQLTSKESNSGSERSKERLWFAILHICSESTHAMAELWGAVYGNDE